MFSHEYLPVVLAVMSLLAVAGLFALSLRRVPPGKFGTLYQHLPKGKAKVLCTYGVGWHLIFPLPGRSFETVYVRKESGAILLAFSERFQPKYQADLTAHYLVRSEGVLKLVIVNGPQLDLDLLVAGTLGVALDYQIGLYPQLEEVRGNMPKILAAVGEFATARLKPYGIRLGILTLNLSTDSILQYVEVSEESE